MPDVQRSLKPNRPEPEMYSEDEPIGWVRKDCCPTRGKAKQWGVGEFGMDWTDARVRTVWLRPVDPDETDYETWGGIGCSKDHPEAEAYWEVRDHRVC